MPVRPKSIVQFELVFWASVALSIVNTALSWNDMMASVQIQQSIARMGMAVVYVPLVLGIAVQLLFWYFIARRGSVIAKWIYVVLVGIGTAWSAFGLATSGGPSPAASVLAVAVIVLDVISFVLLFRPDTRPWFGEDTAAT